MGRSFNTSVTETHSLILFETISFPVTKSFEREV